MPRLIAPSLLSADFGNLYTDIEMVNKSDADWFHLDVMDGMFVPNISFGTPVIKSIKKYAKKPLDVHLMIVDPDRYFNDFKAAGADILTVHYEACTHLHRSLHAIKDLDMKAGIVLNPHTPVHLLKDIIQYADVVLLMSVNPGYGGQRFIQNTLKKISECKEMIEKANGDTLIEVDGGVTLENAESIFEAGADVLVAGNTVFAAAKPIDTIHALKTGVRS